MVAPFQWSDNTCPACVDGIQTSCENGGTFGAPGTDGGQGEAVRVPQADGTLVAVPGGADETMYPALLSTSDVMGTGLHGATLAGVGKGSTVAVIGDGAVGLCAVLGAKAILGAERVILLSRHADRTALGLRFGATDIVSSRDDEGINEVRELTGGLGRAARRPKPLAPHSPGRWQWAWPARAARSARSEYRTPPRNCRCSSPSSII